MRKVMPTVPSDLTDKVILITGASRGIGRSVALNCAQAGAEVIITGRTMGALEELDDEIANTDGKATIVELDQTDTAAMARLAQAIATRWGRLDGFVANAGQLGQMAPMPHIEPEIFEIHHKFKRDAPSGTALALGEAVARGRGPLASIRDYFTGLLSQPGNSVRL